MSDKNPFGPNKGFKSTKSSPEVDDFHRRDDTDSSDRAHHHTLGFNAGQAASGAILRKLIDAGALGRVGDFQFNDTAVETSVWKLANGQLLNIADYPEAFALYGTAHGGDGVTTFGIPDAKERFLGSKYGAGLFMNVIGLKAGVFGNQLNHSHTTATHTHTGPSHSHTGPSHTHTGPSHTHTVSSVSHTGNNTSAGGSNQARVSTLNGAVSGSHDHGGATGSDGTGATGSDGTGATGTDGTGATGSTAPSTNGTTFVNPTLPTFGNDWFDNRPPFYCSNLFVRVALGI